MEVSAKTGNGIKEFFKELACVIAGGKKTKDEVSTKQSIANPPPPQLNNKQSQS